MNIKGCSVCGNTWTWGQMATCICDDFDPSCGAASKPALNVVSIIGAPLPNETAAQLRALADRMDAGEVPDFTAVYYADEQWIYITPGKLTMCAFMAGLLQAACYKKVFEG